MARQAGADGERTARRIREQSVKLFARHGYAAVSMRMIADAVGIQPAAIYQHHAGKQQLLVAVLTGHMRAVLAAWQGEKNAADDPRAALERFARFHIRHHIGRPDAVFISYMELRALEPEGFRAIEALRRAYEDELKAILAAGLSDGTFTCEDPHVAAMALLAMLTGVNTWYRSGGRLSQSEIEDRYASMVLRSVGVVPEGAR